MSKSSERLTANGFIYEIQAESQYLILNKKKFPLTSYQVKCKCINQAGNVEWEDYLTDSNKTPFRFRTAEEAIAQVKVMLGIS